MDCIFDKNLFHGEILKRAIDRAFTIIMFLFIFPPYLSAGDLLNKPAPDFTLSSLDGKSECSLKKLRGKVVIVDFWASWCTPCKKSLPLLQKIKTQYAEDLDVLAVNIDDDLTSARKFVRLNNITLQVLYDRSKEVVARYDIPAMPTAFLIDRQGIIRHIHVGYSGDKAESFIGEINKYL